MVENYEGTKLTDLRINPTGTNKCSPCQSETGLQDNSCDPKNNFFAYNYAEGAPAAAVTDDAGETTSLFFKAGNCGTTPVTYSADNQLAYFSTSIGKETITTDDVIAGSKSYEISCAYQSTIENYAMGQVVKVQNEAVQNTNL